MSSLLNRLLVSVPDFRKDVEKEIKETPPPFYGALNAEEQDAYVRSVTTQRAIVWACRTGASAYNLALILVAAYLLTNGMQLIGIVKDYLAGK